MSKYANLHISTEDNILNIVINRPEKLNALNLATLDELKSAIQRAYDDNEIKGVLVKGAGSKAFVAGADIRELSDLNEVNGRKFSENGQEIFLLFEECPKPVIALVNGFALGGGCELALACHMRIATNNAKFGLPEVSLGIIPGYGGTQRLSQLVGKGKAFEMMITGEMIDADHALQIGLANYVFENEDQALEKCDHIFSKALEKAPLAVGMVVNCINAAFKSDEDGYLMEANSFASCCKTNDFKEGTNAFLKKRKPDFKAE